MKYGILLFHTTTSAFKAEKALIKAGLIVKPVPTPRELSSNCGIALRFSFTDATEIQQKLDRDQIEYEIRFLQGI